MRNRCEIAWDSGKLYKRCVIAARRCVALRDRSLIVAESQRHHSSIAAQLPGKSLQSLRCAFAAHSLRDHFLIFNYLHTKRNHIAIASQLQRDRSAIAL
jgi:hypothetical protein